MPISRPSEADCYIQVSATLSTQENQPWGGETSAGGGRATAAGTDVAPRRGRSTRRRSPRPDGLPSQPPPFGRKNPPIPQDGGAEFQNDTRLFEVPQVGVELSTACWSPMRKGHSPRQTLFPDRSESVWICERCAQIVPTPPV